MADPQIQSKLPENAYRELKPGESYIPMVPPNVTAPEVTTRSIIFGIAMNIVFSMAATYLALKVGQGIETAIPISILAVGLSGFLIKFLGRRGSTLIENVNVLAISTTSGIVAGGTVFTMPAIYVLSLNKNLEMSNISLFLQIFLVPFLGAVLGVLFLIPFRHYFVKDMHGKLPFPEATATNEILVTGSGGGANALVLVYSFALGMLYNCLSTILKLWREAFTTGELTVQWQSMGEKISDSGKAVSRIVTDTTHTLALPSLANVTEKVKAVFTLGTGAEFIGLGFIIGVQYASIICAGSFLSWFVIIPLLAPLELTHLHALNPTISGVSADDIFLGIPRNMGIGCIFTAGLLSILKMGNVIVTALRQALGGLFKSSGTEVKRDRTDEDISYPMLLLIGLIMTVILGVYFRMVVFDGMEGATKLTVVSIVLALGVAFVFTTVSAWAIAMISVTPISGMTVTTIIITAVVLLAVGLPKGDRGMLAVLLVGGVVASALSMAGTLVTEFKIGYWLGASPNKIQWSAIIASLLASALVTATIMVLAHAPGYDPKVNADALQAPQANMMAGALESFIGTGAVPWLMYGVGVVIAILLQMVGVSPLAFGLGMYLPMELNAPILAGAIVALLVKKSSKKENVSKARSSKGILLASGLIAGAAIIGVFKSILTLAAPGLVVALDFSSRRILGGGADAVPHDQVLGNAESVGRAGNWLALVMFIVLCIFVYWDSCRVKPDADAPEIHM